MCKTVLYVCFCLYHLFSYGIHFTFHISLSVGKHFYSTSKWCSPHASVPGAAALKNRGRFSLEVRDSLPLDCWLHPSLFVKVGKTLNPKLFMIC